MHTLAYQHATWLHSDSCSAYGASHFKLGVETVVVRHERWLALSVQPMLIVLMRLAVGSNARKTDPTTGLSGMANHPSGSRLDPYLICKGVL